jgi:hypothetical protein
VDRIIILSKINMDKSGHDDDDDDDDDLCGRQTGKQWLSDCCLTQIQQFFSYVMARTS